MKKLNLAFALLSLLVVSACNSKNNQTSSSSIKENITGIDILAPKRVEIGKTIKITYDVLGTENENVSFKSSDVSIASVDRDGIVKGISEGSVTITITSEANPNIYATHEVTVYREKTSDISLLANGDGLVYDAQNDKYTIPLGKKFTLTASPIDPSKKDFDYYTFELILPSSYSSSVVTLTNLTYNSCEVIGYDDVSDVAIKVKGQYLDNADNGIIKSCYFDIVDANKENKEKVLKTLANLKITEENSLLSSVNEITKEVKTETSLTSKKEVNNFNSYSNCSYVNSTVTTNNEVNNYSYYNGISHNKYYYFSYQDSIINDVYVNRDISEADTLNASLYPMLVNSNPTYGLVNLVETFLTSTSYISDNITSFANTYVYANTSFSFESDMIYLNSSYLDSEVNKSVETSLVINYLEDKLLSFEFTQKLISENEEVTYSNKANNFVYGKRDFNSESSANYLNMNNYYFESFSLRELKGEKTDEYDYSNLKKYGADSVTEVDGIKKYTLTYDKTLVFEVADVLPTTASLKIDTLSSTSSNPDGIKNISILPNSPITISPNKDDNNLAMVGSSTFTFTSTKGYSYSIMVEFIEYPLKSILISNGPENDTFEPIYKDRLTSYFYINTDPDESRYTFSLEVINGLQEGIELFDYEDDNKEGIPGFAYAIKGKVVGSYDFKIIVNEKTSVKSTETFHLEVIEPLSDEYLKEQLVDSQNIYEILGETLTMELSFTSETTATITQSYAYGEVSSRSFNYKIENSYLVIENTTTFDNFYFSRIYAGIINYSNDLTKLDLLVEIYASETDEAIENYYLATFSLHEDKDDLNSYLNNKEYHYESFVVGIGILNFDISFKNQKATLTISKRSDDSLVDIITFNYNYSLADTNLNVSNVTSKNNLVTMDINSYSNGDYKPLRSELSFDLIYNSNSFKIIFII